MGTITQLCFDDAINRADGNALRRIVMAFAFDTGGLVNDVQNTVAFGDGFGGAIGQACAAGDAIVLNFHGHDGFSILNYFRAG